MAVLFPLDDNGQPIPVLGFDYRGTQKLAAATDSSKAASIPDDIEIVTLIATGLCRFEVGDQTVTAASTPIRPRARCCSRTSIWTCRCGRASAASRSSPRARPATSTSSAGCDMPLRLRVTGTGLRITGTPREPGANPPLPPAGALLATENNDLLVTEAGEHILVEPSDGQ